MWRDVFCSNHHRKNHYKYFPFCTYDEKCESKHMFDLWSFLHFGYNIILYIIFSLFMNDIWQILFFALSTNIIFEFIENSNYVINSFRKVGDLGYSGDSLINTFGDIISDLLGIIVANYIKQYICLYRFIVLYDIACLFIIGRSIIFTIVSYLYFIKCNKKIEYKYSILYLIYCNNKFMRL